jgi:uncharacterized membrane protein
MCVDGVNTYTCNCAAGYFGTQCATARFAWLGTNGADAWGISADGKVIAGAIPGTSRSVPARWTEATGFQALQSLGEPIDQGYAKAANADGTVLVGQANLASGGGAFRWTAATGVVALGLGPVSVANGVSSNGTAVVGRMYGTENPPQIHMYRWTAAAGAQDLMALGLNGLVNGVSADGTTIAGGYIPVAADNLYAPFRWTQTPGLIRLTNDTPGYAEAISLDGTTVVGTVKGPFRYTNTSGFAYMTLTGFTNAAAYAVSGNGSVVAGSASEGPWIWDATNGARSFVSVLTSLGANLTNWSSLTIKAISSDGKVMCGTGYRNNAWNSWIARF